MRIALLGPGKGGLYSEVHGLYMQVVFRTNSTVSAWHIDYVSLPFIVMRNAIHLHNYIGLAVVLLVRDVVSPSKVMRDYTFLLTYS